jgi:glycosyltransferase involved in cell wall biosynthesis
VINIAFTMIGGQDWRGGYNYLINLLDALSVYAKNDMSPFLFIGNDVKKEEIAPFLNIQSLTIIKSDVFNKSEINLRLLRSIVLGLDKVALNEFTKKNIDIVFESAQFYGWRFPLPTLAWIPDFQHKYLRDLFGWKAYWKREIGFRIQVVTGRHILLSSYNAKIDCENFYPKSKGRTHVFHFSVPSKKKITPNQLAEVVALYNLPTNFFFLPNQFWKHKNHECVIYALNLLRIKKINIFIIATGQQYDSRDPAHFSNLKKLIKEFNLEENFRILGSIPYEHVRTLMYASLALINPSKYEGWSTTVEEAKALNVPMILSSISVHKEQAPNAIFFDPHSSKSLSRILEEKEIFFLKLNAVRKKRELVSNSDMQIFAKNFLSILKSMR